MLTARESAIQEIVAEAKFKLREVSKNPTTYKKLLTDLLVQVSGLKTEHVGGSMHHASVHVCMCSLDVRALHAGACQSSWASSGTGIACTGCTAVCGQLEHVHDPRSLHTQAMKKLDEKSATVKCRQVDLILVKEVLEPARKNFTALFQQDAPVLTLDQSSFLPPPPQGNAEDGVPSRCLFRQCC